ncbi:MAG: hypothetical protein HS115_02250 [Spirochaetales bacterium]|nr:hypothetical protein [Spirochaetales bacterium]
MEEQESSREVPVDKKRIALFNGACGQSGHIVITGQVVDIPITESHRDEEWDLYTPIPYSQKKKIRPIQDFGMSGVRRPRLQLEVLNHGSRNLRPHELDSVEVLFTSEEFKGNDNSFFSYDLKADLPPGNYLIRIILRGVDSLRQSVSDLSFIGNSDSLILKRDIPIGYGPVRILPADYSGYIISSDIDQTFLDTRIGSTQGLMETLFETPESKQAIPGMPEFIREILRAQNPPYPLHFISASPHFFRRTLSTVFDDLDIHFSSLNLKYLASTVENVFKKTFDTIFHFDDLIKGGVSTAINRTMKFLGSSIQSLYDQIAYKLTTLLENRLTQPRLAREVLLGDNTESDFLIFSLYQHILLGHIKGEDLENFLYKLNFQEREALTRDAARGIAELAAACLKKHGQHNSVVAVWINQAFEHPDQSEMRALIESALPEGCRDATAVVPVKGAAGALGFALHALDLGLIDREAVKRIWHSMKGRVYGTTPIDDEFARAALKTTTAISPGELLDSVPAPVYASAYQDQLPETD